MAENLKLFNEHSEYEDFIQTDDFIRPNVSYCIQEDEVHYNSITPHIIVKFFNGNQLVKEFEVEQQEESWNNYDEEYYINSDTYDIEQEQYLQTNSIEINFGLNVSNVIVHAPSTHPEYQFTQQYNNRVLLIQPVGTWDNQINFNWYVEFRYGGKNCCLFMTINYPD